MENSRRISDEMYLYDFSGSTETDQIFIERLEGISNHIRNPFDRQKFLFVL